MKKARQIRQEEFEIVTKNGPIRLACSAFVFMSGSSRVLSSFNLVNWNRIYIHV
jgi:hypothetical protein